MALKIQNYYSIIIENNLNIGSGSLFLFYSDIMLYAGIIILLIVFGIAYKHKTILELHCIVSSLCKAIIMACTIILVLQLTLVNNFHLVSLLSNSYYASVFTHVNKIILLLIAYFIFTYLSRLLISKHYLNAAELPLLLYISIVLATTIISSNQYAIILLALEGFSLTLYILTTIDRAQGGIIAAAKYFSFGTLGSVLLFWGVVHIYSFIPTLSLDIIKVILMDSSNSIGNSLEFASSMILIGLLIKLGAAPLHQWVADVYAGSHLIITTYFSTFAKYIIFILLAVLALHFNNNNIINIFALLSLVIGTFMTVRQTEIKRFLAYSSITHVGFMLIGDIISSYVYILTYICSSLLFFSVLLFSQRNNKEFIYFSDISILKNNGLWSPMLLTVSLISMAGLPPFSGFYGKLLIWGSLIEDIYLFNDSSSYIILVVSIVLSLITIYYYIRVLVYVFVNDDYSNLYCYTIASSTINTLAVYQQQGLLLLIITFWTFLQPGALTLVIHIWASYFNI